MAECAFGAATDTQDATGKIIETGENYPDFSAVQEGRSTLSVILSSAPVSSAPSSGRQATLRTRPRWRECRSPGAHRACGIHRIARGNARPRRSHDDLLRTRDGHPLYLRRFGEADGLPGTYALPAAHAERRVHAGQRDDDGGSSSVSGVGDAAKSPAAAGLRHPAYAACGCAGMAAQAGVQRCETAREEAARYWRCRKGRLCACICGTNSGAWRRGKGISCLEMPAPAGEGGEQCESSVTRSAWNPLRAGAGDV